MRINTTRPFDHVLRAAERDGDAQSELSPPVPSECGTVDDLRWHLYFEHDPAPRKLIAVEKDVTREVVDNMAPRSTRCHLVATRPAKLEEARARVEAGGQDANAVNLGDIRVEMFRFTTSARCGRDDNFSRFDGRRISFSRLLHALRGQEIYREIPNDHVLTFLFGPDGDERVEQYETRMRFERCIYRSAMDSDDRALSTAVARYGTADDEAEG